MTKQERIEKVVKAIVDDFKREMESDSYYSDIESWGEMIKMFGYDTEDLKEEVEAIVNEQKLWDCFDDDDLTIAGDSDYCTDDVAFKDYMKLVRKDMNKWFKERA